MTDNIPADQHFTSNACILGDGLPHSADPSRQGLVGLTYERVYCLTSGYFLTSPE